MTDEHERAIYLCGRYPNDDSSQWEVLGIYTSREAAVARCRERRDFVWKTALDEDAPEGRVDMDVEWPLNV